jgi:hypothetical protein
VLNSAVGLPHSFGFGTDRGRGVSGFSERSDLVRTLRSVFSPAASMLTTFSRFDSSIVSVGVSVVDGSGDGAAFPVALRTHCAVVSKSFKRLEARTRRIRTEYRVLSHALNDNQNSQYRVLSRGYRVLRRRSSCSESLIIVFWVEFLPDSSVVAGTSHLIQRLADQAKESAL